MKYDDEVWSRLKPRRSDAAPSQRRSSSATAKRTRQRKASSVEPDYSSMQQDDRPIKNSTPKHPTTPSAQKTSRGMRSKIQKVAHVATPKKKLLIGGALAVIALGGIVVSVVRLMDDDRGDGAPQSLGVSEEDAGRSQMELPELPEATPSFAMLYPSSNEAGDYRTVRVSPEGNTPAYTYLDDVSGATVRVTQQQVNDIPSYEGLGAVAEDFQATDVVQLDDLLIYHGINERSGVQSVITEKDQILVLIASPRQLPEEVWVSYIASLE